MVHHKNFKLKHNYDEGEEIIDKVNSDRIGIVWQIHPLNMADAIIVYWPDTNEREFINNKKRLEEEFKKTGKIFKELATSNPYHHPGCGC